MSDPIVETTAGRVRGIVDATFGVSVFKGIPYGDSTSGANRFRAPRPVQPWLGTKDCFEYGPSCPQRAGTREMTPAALERAKRGELFGMPIKEPSQGEDCLVLNIFTPGTGTDDNKKRSVMFRIHGGGYGVGSGSWPKHDARNLVRKNDVVVVTVNHRLGSLGFLYLAHIDPSRADATNASLLDLVLALEWVRDNISKFGGDPNNVTLFGESGGGMKISLLLTMPAAKDLFHKAVVQSGPGLRVKDPETGAKAADALLQGLGISPSNLAELEKVPLQRIIDVQLKLTKGGIDLNYFGPAIDPTTLPVQPADAFSAGASSDIPLMIGYTRHEQAMFWYLEGAPEVTEATLPSKLQPLLSDVLKPTLAAGNRLYANTTATERYLILLSAVMFGKGSHELAERRSTAGISNRNKAPVYFYLFSWRSPIEGGKLGAAHGMCVPMSMDCISSTPYANQEGGQKMADVMSASWSSFAKTGNPNHAGLGSEWSPYDAKERKVMVFDTVSREQKDPDGAIREAVKGGFFALM